jgi:hypothetical protein
MDRHLIRLSVPGCILIAVLSVPTTAQQVALENGLTASTQSVYAPPACVPGVPFADITCTTGFDPWIEQFGLDGITAGCGGGNYCPSTPVTRDQMAVFIEKSMRGTANWPPHTVLVVHHQAAEANSNVNSGTELMSMVAAIPSSGSEAPSATNPWLVRIGPGIYDLGSESLHLPAYTALEGAGRDITVVAAAGYGGAAGTVIMADHGKLSRLTVANAGSAGFEIAVYLPPSVSKVALEHVTLTASSPSNASGVAVGLFADTTTSLSLVDCDLTVHGAHDNFGIMAHTSSDESRLDGVRVNVYGSNPSGTSYGFWGSGAAPVITNTRFYVSDGSPQYGVYAVGGGGALDLRNSEVYTYGAGSIAVSIGSINATLLGNLISSPAFGIATGGSGLSADISNCNIKGGTYWLLNGSGFTVTVGASKLVGTTVNSSGAVNCFGNYTGSAFLTNTCP